MPLDPLASRLVTLTRDQRRDLFLRDMQFRNPAALTLPGTDPNLEAQVFADATEFVVANAVTIANGIARATMTGQQLDDEAKRLGTFRLPAAGGGGAGSASLRASGAKIFAGDILKHPASGLRFQCTATATYLPSQPIPIVGIDTGAATNLAVGTILNWQSPRPGCGLTATILLQADGSGLSGGAPAELDDMLRARLDERAANPPASGNDADYQSTVSATPLVAVQQAFTTICCMGPGSIGLAFTLRPAQPGANRIPSATQLALMCAAVQGLMPGDDGVYPIALIASPTTVVLKALWARGASSWADAQTWPPYNPSPNLVSCQAPMGPNSPTFFRVDGVGITQPSVGQSIAFFDLASLVFRRKKIGAVAVDGTGGYDITVDTSAGLSDTSYTPVTGQACCPWSDSLNTIVPAVVAYFDTLGPGEMFASFFDPGLRQKRSPPSPQLWPSIITNRLLGGASVPVPATGPQQNSPPTPTLFTTPTLQDVVLAEPAVPYATPTGTPGISLNLITLGASLIVFPE